MLTHSTLLQLIHVLLILQVFNEFVNARRKFTGTKKYSSSRNPGIPVWQSWLLKKSKLCTESNDNGQPYRYHIESKRCYIVGERGPCNELMEFTLVDQNYGTCDCSQKLRCGRPLIYWPETKRCYHVNDQGPCSDGKWLVFGLYDLPICKRNPCQSKLTSNKSRGSNFWFEYRGECYRTGSKGYCPGKNQVLFNDWHSYKPKCTDIDNVKCKKLNSITKTECLPGMKTDYSEVCVSTVHRNKPGRYGAQEKLPNVYHLTVE